MTDKQKNKLGPVAPRGVDPRSPNFQGMYWWRHTTGFILGSTIWVQPLFMELGPKKNPFAIKQTMSPCDIMIDPYYQRRKCSAETLVCKDISRGIICRQQGGPRSPSDKKMCSAKRPITPTRVTTSLLDVFHDIVIFKQFVCTSMLPLGHPVPPV